MTLVKPEARVGQEWGGGVGIEHTYNHTLRPDSLERMLRNPLALSRAPRPVPHNWTHTDTGKGELGAHANSRRDQSESPADARQSGGVLGGRGSPFLPARGQRAEEGEPRWQGREAGRGPHSTLQQLMQPFWEP